MEPTILKKKLIELNLSLESKIIEENNIIPAVDPTEFTLDQVNEALRLVASGHPKGKVVIKVSE